MKVLHSLEVPVGMTTGQNDRVSFGMLFNQAYGAGGGAGQSVSLVVSGLKLPPNYMVDVELNADACAYVTSKTQSGFTVVITPRLAANTLASGTANINVMA